MSVWQEHSTSYRLLKKWQMSHRSVVATTARDDLVDVLAASEGSRASSSLMSADGRGSRANTSHLQKMVSTRMYTNVMGL